ncbi:MAG: ABC transporter permease [Gemmatimonadota bacterium]
METVLGDLRFAARTLVRSPGFAIAAVATLGLGIGATTMVFSLVNAILLRPFPYAVPERLIQLTETDRSGQYESTSYPNFVDYRSGMNTLNGLGAYSNETLTLRGQGGAQRVEGSAISYNLFDILGIRPLIGRTFRADEDVPTAERVVLLGYGLWQNSFGGDRALVGGTLNVDGEPHVVIGVMPPDFSFPEQGQAWVPLRRDPTAERGLNYITAIGRLAPGAIVAQARTEAEAIRQRLSRDYTSGSDRVVRVGGLQETSVSEIKPVLLILLAAVGFVLLIACANVANLLLSRAASRDKEIAIRTALGAGRARLVRQLLTESVLLGLLGGALGVLLSSWWMDLMLASIPTPLPAWLKINIDRTVLLFTLAVAFVTALLFGLAPALQSIRTDVQATLKEGRGITGSFRKNRLRSALVVAQLALAVVLLTGGLLMVKSFLAMRQVNPGFRIENVVAVDLALPGQRYDSEASRLVFYDRLLEKAAAIPGVQQVGAISAVPIGGANNTSNFTVEGRSPSDPEAARNAFHTIVTPGYFETMGIPLVRGRYFRSTDLAGSERVAIVNQRVVDLFFEGEDPVGKRIAWGAGEGLEWMTIVGVTANVNQADINQKAVHPEIHQPLAQSARRSMSLMLRASGTLDQLRPALQREVQSLDPNIPLFNVQTMKQVVTQAVWDSRLYSSLFGAFAAAALLLAAVGLYGVIAYSVSQRTPEIGVRIALGAEPSLVTRMIVWQGIRLSALGVGLGLLGAVAMGQAMQGLLYGVQPIDPLTFVAVPLLLTGVATLASWIPARRVLRVDPITALRLE